jgi:hypothetical protein
MIEVFKTNIENDETAERIKNIIFDAFPECYISFDLNDCDRILRVKGRDISSSIIINILKLQNIECQVLD